MGRSDSQAAWSKLVLPPNCDSWVFEGKAKANHLPSHQLWATILSLPRSPPYLLCSFSKPFCTNRLIKQREELCQEGCQLMYAKQLNPGKYFFKKAPPKSISPLSPAPFTFSQPSSNFWPWGAFLQKEEDRRQIRGKISVQKQGSFLWFALRLHTTLWASCIGCIRATCYRCSAFIGRVFCSFLSNPAGFSLGIPLTHVNVHPGKRVGRPRW